MKIKVRMWEDKKAQHGLQEHSLKVLHERKCHKVVFLLFAFHALILYPKNESSLI